MKQQIVTPAVLANIDALRGMITDDTSELVAFLNKGLIERVAKFGFTGNVIMVFKYHKKITIGMEVELKQQLMQAGWDPHLFYNGEGDGTFEYELGIHSV